MAQLRTHNARPATCVLRCLGILTLAQALSKLHSCACVCKSVTDWQPHCKASTPDASKPSDSVRESSGNERTSSCTSRRYGGEDVTSLMLLGTLTDDRKVPVYHHLLAAAVSTSWPWHISRSCRTAAALLQPYITPLAATHNYAAVSNSSNFRATLQHTPMQHNMSTIHTTGTLAQLLLHF